MVLRYIKKFIFAGITAGLCLYSGSMSAKITTKEVIVNLCDKTMTSEIMEDYLRNNRLKERMQVWKDDLNAWKQRWDVVLDANFKLDSLTDEAFDELCEIPFYMFAADMLGEADLPEQLQEEFFEKVYVHSDKDTLDILTKIHAKLGYAEAKAMAKEILEGDAAGFCIPSKHLFKTNKVMWINDILISETGQLDIPFILFVTEHELTHIEQGLDAAALDIMVKKYFDNKEILRFLECIKHYKNIFVSQERRTHLEMTTRFAYELYAFMQHGNENNSSFSDLVDYNSCSDEIEDLSIRLEIEADKRAIRFITCPMLMYHQYKHLDINDDAFDARGYFSENKIAKLLVDRLIEEGRWLTQDVAPRIPSKNTSRKFIWWPSEYDRKELSIFDAYQDRYDGLLQSAL